MNSKLQSRILDGRRISRTEAMHLYRDCSLNELGMLADEVRWRRKAAAYGGRGNRIITYVIDRNINYTNVCRVRCRFCAFSRGTRDRDAYVLTRARLDHKIRETLSLGGTQILLQGGHHPKLDLDFYLDLLAHIKRRFPTIHIHAFSPPEIQFFHRQFRLPVREVIARLHAAGLDSIPGGGAEILVDRVRRRISPRKGTARDWLEVMATAHDLGLRTTATMMFGHVETPADRIEHLQQLRDLQDRTGGFTAFICWTFQPANTRLPLPPAGACEYLRTQALSRIFLDNFENVQASWVTQGPKIGQVALQYGANDLGSLMIEENVVAQAGTRYQMTVAEMQHLIRELGYEPRQRDCYYRLLP
jgi:cyclic dehypoxanthinyl futalosine synthase